MSRDEKSTERIKVSQYAPTEPVDATSELGKRIEEASQGLARAQSEVRVAVNAWSSALVKRDLAQAVFDALSKVQREMKHDA